MATPWPEVDSGSALVFGLVGIIIGWLSYRAGVRSHYSTLRVEAQTLSDTIKRILDEVAGERGGLFKWYQNLYAA
jgi:hypothetical protein